MKKKILCLVLAIAMMLSLSAMVGAVSYDDDGNFKDESTITITKTYKLENAGTTSPAETFEFTIEAYSVEDSVEGVTAENMPLPTIGSAVYAEGAATTNGTGTGTVTVTITLPGLASDDNPAVITDGVYSIYPGVGVYTYTITEDEGATAGVTYDGSTLYLVVTVIEQDGQLRVATVHAENETTNKTSTFDANKYSAGSLSVTKKVDGNLGDKTKYFDVTVTLTGEEGKTYADSYAVSGGSNNENPATVEVKAGETTTYTFKLKDEDTITIENLPYGVTYTITESTDAAENDGYDAPVYSTNSEETDTTYDITQGSRTTEGSVTASSVSGEIDDASDAVTITNNKSGDVDTGVILESMPYVMILAVVVVGGIALISKRKVSE